MLCSFFSRSCEVVNADSVQVYRTLDIGSAKADKETLRIIPHHLIDIRDPWETWNVSDFVSLADKACEDIRSRGKIPVISGGTAFYFKNFLYGLSKAPASDPVVRQRVADFMKSCGREAAYARLKEVDPVSAARININDTYRISRALEVWESCGEPLSSFALPTQPRNGMEVLVIGLYLDKDILARRIRRRVDLMFEAGLKDEIARLVSQGAGLEWQSMQGIGYREFFSAMQDGTSFDNLDFESIKEQIVMNSIHYAKRQMTFFRSFENVHWIKSSDPEELRALLAASAVEC